MAQAPAAASPHSAQCFHCGLDIPAGCELQVCVEGVPQRVCCAGCQAIVLSITDRGLESFYRLRSDQAAPASAPDADNPDPGFYDEPAVQARFVRNLTAAQAGGDDQTGNWREADLLIEGMRCAACAWLVEQTLRRLPGVREAQVLYATHRARVIWNAAGLPPSRLLAAVQAVGYRAFPYEAGKLEALEKSERRDALWRLFVAGFGMMQVMMYAFPVYLAEAGSMSADIEQLMRWAGLILTLPVLLYSAAPFFTGAWHELRERSPGMEVPVALGLGAAFAASLWSTLVAAGPVYYDSVAMFVFLLLAGRYLELLARQKAGRALQGLARLVPETAHRLSGLSGGNLETVPAQLLQPGDRVLVRPGETLPADGRLDAERAQVDEALLSGESRPMARARDDALIVTALGVGLLGGVHCVAMCGGVVGAYILVRPASIPAARTLPAQLRFNLGRIASYSLAGALAGGFSEWGIAAASLLPLQTMLFVAANGLLMLLGLHLTGRGRMVLALERTGGRLWPLVRKLGQRLPQAQTPGSQLAAGALWGWTPCGLVYSMLALALVSGSTARGAAVMAAFGLGTLPNLLAAGWLLNRFGENLRRPGVRLAAGLAVAGFGLVGMLRVPGLAEHIKAGLLCLGA